MEDFLNIFWMILTTIVFIVLLTYGYELIDIMALKYGWQWKILGICIVAVIFKIYFYVTSQS